MTDQPASHIIVHRESGLPVQEVFGPRPVLAAPVAESYEVVPVLEWLQRVNSAERVRQMTAELPADQRSMLQLKGMI